MPFEWNIYIRFELESWLITMPVFWGFVLPAQIVLPAIKKIGSTSDGATSILFMWFEAFLMSIPTLTLNLPVHTHPYPKLTLKRIHIYYW